MKHAVKVVTLTLIAPIFLLAGCGKKDPVAGLNELPAQSTANLKLVPDLYVQPYSPRAAFTI
jgi:predicted small lipoprotein YifL